MAKLKFAKPITRRTRRATAAKAHRLAVAEVRRQVFERDRGLCRACSSLKTMTAVAPGVLRNIWHATQMHEIIFRSHDRHAIRVDNCIPLCTSHHAQIHARTLWIVGTDANGPLQFTRVNPKARVG